MAPILVRPVREQLEHDRVIRLLQAKWRRKYNAEANPGDERNAVVKVKGTMLYPDLLLTNTESGRRLQTIVEVETGESLNNLEAMSQWVSFGKSKIPFHLYVPAHAVEQAKRLMTAHEVPVSELWSYFSLGEKVRFLQVYRAPRVEASLEREREPEAPSRAIPSRPSKSASKVKAPRSAARRVPRSKVATSKGSSKVTARRARPKTASRGAARKNAAGGTRRSVARSARRK